MRAPRDNDPWDGGVAYFNDELPLVWDVNFARLDRDAEDLPATIDAAAGRAVGTARS